MALQYFFNEDEYAGPSQGLDDTGEHFWAGVFRAAAPLALAATVAAIALSTQVAAAQATPADEVFASLTPDEDYAPTVLQIPLWHSAWYAGTAAPPAPIAEEDAWQPWLAAPPDLGALYLVAPWAWGSGADDLAIVGNTVAPADEDYWQNGVLPVAATLAWPAPASFEQHDLAPPGQPEEEFWNSGVAAAQWSYAPLWPWALDPQAELSVPGTPDEDYWTSGVAPAAYALRGLPVWASDPLDEQAAGLVAPPAVVPATFAWVRPFGVAPFTVLVHPVRLFSDVAGTAAAAFTPTQLAGLFAWYRADAIGGLVDGDPIASWTDSTGQANTLTQSTAAQRPTYKVNIQNGLPVVRFDGVDDFLGTAAFASAIPQPDTIFIVLQSTGPNADNNLWYDAVLNDSNIQRLRDDVVSNRIVISTSVTNSIAFATRDGNWHQYCAVYNGANSFVHRDGISSGAISSVGNDGLDGLTVGGRLTGPAQNAQIDVAEILLYNRTLSADEITSVEVYLRAKWGTP